MNASSIQLPSHLPPPTRRRPATTAKKRRRWSITVLMLWLLGACIALLQGSSMMFQIHYSAKDNTSIQEDPQQNILLSLPTTRSAATSISTSSSTLEQAQTSYHGIIDNENHGRATDTTTSIIITSNSSSTTAVPTSSTPPPATTTASNTSTQATTATTNSNSNSNNHNSSSFPSSPYAYVFLIGGIQEEGMAYRGFVYNVLLAIHHLRNYGSTADVMVYLQFSPAPNLSNRTRKLPTEVQGWFDRLGGIQLKILPTPPSSNHESFASLMLDKFRATLPLTQYRRVMYLDSDVLPLTNMDYLFHMTDPSSDLYPTLLQSNLLIATAKEPANGGFFVAAPQQDSWPRLQAIMERQRIEGQRLPYPHFSFRRGWGHDHEIIGDDWHSIKKNGTRWKFHAGHSDQGLLYYFFKYIVQDTTIFVGSQMEHHTKGPDEDHPILRVQDTVDTLLEHIPFPALRLAICKKQNQANWTFGCYPPYRDYHHFTGKSKPWQRECKQWFFKKEHYSSLKEKFNFWFVELRKLNTILRMGLDFHNWNAKYLAGLQESPLGYQPHHSDNMHRYIDTNFTNEIDPIEDGEEDDASEEAESNMDPPHHNHGLLSFEERFSVDRFERASVQQKPSPPSQPVKQLTIKKEPSRSRFSTNNTSSTNSRPHAETLLHSLEAKYLNASQSFIQPTNALHLPYTNGTSPYAYSFIIGSVHETQTAYKGFLWNVLAAVQMLKESGSKADFIIFLQLAPDSELGQKVPEEDLTAIQKMDIEAHLLPRPKRAAFADLMFEKFRALQLTQYRRVMYMDSDILPLTNLDYLFHLSDPEEKSMPTILRPNIMQATMAEPSNGGFFVMRPFPGAYERLQAVIERQKIEGQSLKYPHFNLRRGWGHSFIKFNDNWQAIKESRTTWKFHGAFVDQGLLYYFFKYYLQDASAIVGNRVMNWLPGEELHVPRLDDSLVEGTLLQFSSGPSYSFEKSCLSPERHTWDFNCYPPYRDVFHYKGTNKPWQKNISSYMLEPNVLLSSPSSPTRLWFHELEKLNRHIGLGLNLSNWNSDYFPLMQTSPLGYFPLYVDNHYRIIEHNESNSTDL